MSHVQLSYLQKVIMRKQCISAHESKMCLKYQVLSLHKSLIYLKFQDGGRGHCLWLHWLSWAIPLLEWLIVTNNFKHLIHMKSVTNVCLMLEKIGTSSQDGHVGRYTVPPCTTKRRTTTNLKTKNNWNWQKIKLYETLITKELKKKHSFRQVGRAERSSQGRKGQPGQRRLMARQWLVDRVRWQLADNAIHICVWINQE